jgi:hypothetical protein
VIASRCPFADQLLDEFSITNPLRTATPDKATVAEIEKGISRNQSAATPPVSASGTALNARIVVPGPRAPRRSRNIIANSIPRPEARSMERRETAVSVHVFGDTTPVPIIDEKVGGAVSKRGYPEHQIRVAPAAEERAGAYGLVI